jgi:hypothetical protein
VEVDGTRSLLLDRTPATGQGQSFIPNPDVVVATTELVVGRQ